MKGEAGFSLIEALVALAILAMSATALIGATEAYVAHVRGLEDRAAAQWVAENALTEIQTDPAAQGRQSEDVTMLDRTWTVRIDYDPTGDPELSKVNIAVGEQGGEPLVQFHGFVDRQAGAAK